MTVGWAGIQVFWFDNYYQHEGKRDHGVHGCTIKAIVPLRLSVTPFLGHPSITCCRLCRLLTNSDSCKRIYDQLATFTAIFPRQITLSLTPHSNSFHVLPVPLPSRFFQILCVILWRFSLTKRWKTISFSISSFVELVVRNLSPFSVSFIAFKLTFAFRISNSTVCNTKFQFIAFYFSPKREE